MVSGQLNPTLSRTIWFRALLAPFLIVLLVFGSAGRIDYWQGWVYVTLACLSLGGTWAVLRNNPDLIAERLQPRQGMAQWDKSTTVT